MNDASRFPYYSNYIVEQVKLKEFLKLMQGYFDLIHCKLISYFLVLWDLIASTRLSWVNFGLTISH